MQQKDYYQILEIEKNAGPEQIKTAYRKMAFKNHPDKCGDDPAAAERMKGVNEAYAVLSDSKKRQEYDQMGQQYGSSAHTHFRSSYSEQDIFNGSDINQIFEEMAKSFGFRGTDDIFGNFYGSSYQTFKFGKKGRGMTFSFSTGFGKKGGGFKNLFGQQMPGDRIGQSRGQDLLETIVLTPKHAREGGPYAYLDKQTGKKFLVKIPPGTLDGKKFRLAGMGGRPSEGAVPGDLYLKVTIRPESLWGRAKGFFTSLLDFDK